MRAEGRFDVCELENLEIDRFLDAVSKGLRDGGANQAVLLKVEFVEVSPTFPLVWAHETKEEGDFSVGTKCSSSVFQIMPRGGMVERLACSDKRGERGTFAESHYDE